MMRSARRISWIWNSSVARFLKTNDRYDPLDAALLLEPDHGAAPVPAHPLVLEEVDDVAEAERRGHAGFSRLGVLPPRDTFLGMFPLRIWRVPARATPVKRHARPAARRAIEGSRAVA